MGVVESILRLRDEASPALRLVADEAAGAEEAIRGASDAADDAGEEIKGLAERTNEAGAALGDMADAFSWFLAAPAAVAAAVVGIGAFTDAIQSARLELDATAREAGLTRDQVEALQAAARTSGRSLGDLAEEYKNLGAKGREELDKLATKSGTTTDEQIKDAKRWKASLEDVYGVFGQLTSGAADIGSNLGQNLIDGVAYASVVISEIIAELGRRIRADFELITTTIAGGMNISVAGLKALSTGSFAELQATQAEVLSRISDDYDRLLVETSESFSDVVANATKAADEMAAKIGETRQLRVDLGGRVGGAGGGGTAPAPAADAETGARFGGMSGLFAAVDQRVQQEAELAAATQDLIAATHAEEAARLVAARDAQLARVQSGIGIAGQAASGDLAGLLALAGPQGAAAGAAVSLLQQLGTQGAAGTADLIRDSVQQVLDGILMLPELIVVELPRLIPELAIGIARAILFELPKAFLEAFKEFWGGVWKDLKDLFTPFNDGDGRGRDPRVAALSGGSPSTRVGAAQAFNLLSDLGLFRGRNGRDRRAGAVRRATREQGRRASAGRTLEDRALGERQRRWDLALLGEG